MAFSKSPATTEYTLEQIAQHNTPEDVWIVLHGKVYDVSQYLDDHPGGKDVLVESAGTDATSDFDFVGHSEEAMKALATFQVGSLAGHAARVNKAARKQVSRVEKGKQQKSMLRQVAQPKLLVLFISVGAGVTLMPALIDSILTHYQLDARNILEFGGFQSGVLATLVVLSLFGWVVFSWVHRFLFHYKDVFAYQPYYSLPA